MSIIRQWAARNQVSITAVAELESLLGITGINAVSTELRAPDDAPGEARQQSLVVLEAARLGVRLFRNNSGALKAEDGQLVRFGLGNTTAQFNKVMKSPDLVGWRKRVITPEMVGSVIGQACMREMKDLGWSYSGTAHEQAQLNWINLAVADGCDAAFATGPGTL